MARFLLVGRVLVLGGLVYLAACPLKAAEWVVVGVSGLPLKVVVAEKVEEKGGMVTLRDAKGIALGAWQKEAIVGRAAQLPDSRETWTVDQVQRQVGELEAFVAQHPVAASLVNPSLKDARFYLKQQQEKVAALEAEKKEQLKKRVDALLSPAIPDRATPPALADLELHINEGQALLKETPAEASRIEEHLKPWIEIRDALSAGKKWFEESWKTDEEIKAVQEGRRKEALDKVLGKTAQMEVSAIVVNAGDMKKIQISVVAALAIGMVTILGLLCWRTSTSTMINTKTQGQIKLKHSNTVLTLLKGVVLLAALIVVGVEGFYVYRLWLAAPGAVTQEVDPATSEDLARMVYACSQPAELKSADVPVAVALEAGVVNQHLAKNLFFKDDLNDGALVRKAWMIDVSPQAIYFTENLQCGTHTWTARYEILLTEGEAGTRLSGGRVTVDGMPVPNIMGNLLWNSFKTEVFDWTRRTQLDTHYAFTGVDKDKIKFKLTTMPTVTP